MPQCRNIDELSWAMVTTQFKYIMQYKVNHQVEERACFAWDQYTRCPSKGRVENRGAVTGSGRGLTFIAVTYLEGFLRGATSLTSGQIAQ